MAKALLCKFVVRISSPNDWTDEQTEKAIAALDLLNLDQSLDAVVARARDRAAADPDLKGVSFEWE